ncbi:MAG: dihydrolipoyl dehydrogenase [Chloroflexi bacterium]|nr:dihydrolipoyl dehydrogenase [Chloroflexota bacterium]
MAENDYDVAIVGAGTGGYVAAIRGGQLGLKVALIEEDKVGGVCLHRGCIPTKALLESAEVYSLSKRGQEYGVIASDVKFDYLQMATRKDKIVSQLHKGVEFLLKKNKVTVVKGKARLESPTSLFVGLGDGASQRIQARNVIIATGSQPKELPGLPTDGENVINSDHAVNLTEPPKSVIIVGAGATGVEFATLYHSLDIPVTILQRNHRLLPKEDEEVSKNLERAFTRTGIKLVTTAAVLGSMVRVGRASVEVEVTRDGGIETYVADKVLVAVGREGRVKGIGLEEVGVRVDDSFIKVDERKRTTVPNVLAIGDVIGGLMLAHRAMTEGILVMESIAGKRTEVLQDERIPRSTWCRPQVGSLGLSEQEAKAKGFNVKVGRFSFRANSMALIRGETDGFAKIIADEDTGEILGAHLIGPGATELVAETALAKLLESTPWELALSVHAHPTLSEAIMEAARDVDGWAIHV